MKPLQSLAIPICQLQGGHTCCSRLCQSLLTCFFRDIGTNFSVQLCAMFVPHGHKDHDQSFGMLPSRPTNPGHPPHLPCSPRFPWTWLGPRWLPRQTWHQPALEIDRPDSRWPNFSSLPHSSTHPVTARHHDTPCEYVTTRWIEMNQGSHNLSCATLHCRTRTSACRIPTQIHTNPSFRMVPSECACDILCLCLGLLQPQSWPHGNSPAFSRKYCRKCNARSLAKSGNGLCQQGRSPL